MMSETARTPTGRTFHQSNSRRPSPSSKPSSSSASISTSASAATLSASTSMTLNATLPAAASTAPTGSMTTTADPLKVYIRVRPFTSNEKKKLFSPGSTPTSDGSVLFGESPLTYFSQEEASAVRMKDNTVHLSMPGRGSTPFTFDDVYWSNADIPVKATDMDDEGREGVKDYACQETVFEAVGRPLVDNALMGYNSALIAYGQTGSGKTHTIFGPGAPEGGGRGGRGSQSSSGANTPRESGTVTQQQPLSVEDGRGLIPRVCDEVFSRLNGRLGRSGNVEVHTVTMSMWELYLEDAFDLLQARKKLAVRQDTPGSFCVVGHREVPVRSYGEVLQLIRDGECLRTTAATAMNARSSRAHTLFQLKITTKSDMGIKVAKVVLADLAGCERIKVAKTDKGTALDEACNINLSLLSLGNCIEAAVQRSKTGKTTENMGEFRQSVLTKLLKEFIGGNSRTAIMVTIAPTLNDSHLSMQALRFANRAKQIQNHATVNMQMMRPSGSDMLSSPSGSAVDWEVAGVREAYALKLDLLKKECGVEMARVSAKRRYQSAYSRLCDIRSEKDEIMKSSKGPHTDPNATTSIRTRLLQMERALEAANKELQDAQKAKEELDDQLLQLCKDSQHILSDKEALQQEADGLRLSLADLANEQADAVIQHEIECSAIERAAAKKLEAQRLEHAEVVAGLQRNISVITSNAAKQLAHQLKLRDEALSQMEAFIRTQRALSDEEELNRCRLVYAEEQSLSTIVGMYYWACNVFESAEREAEMEAKDMEFNDRLKAIVGDLTAKLEKSEARASYIAKDLQDRQVTWTKERDSFSSRIAKDSAALDDLRRQLSLGNQSGAALAQQCAQARDALTLALSAFSHSNVATPVVATTSAPRAVTAAVTTKASIVKSAASPKTATPDKAPAAKAVVATPTKTSSLVAPVVSPTAVVVDGVKWHRAPAAAPASTTTSSPTATKKAPSSSSVMTDTDSGADIAEFLNKAVSSSPSPSRQQRRQPEPSPSPASSSAAAASALKERSASVANRAI